MLSVPAPWTTPELVRSCCTGLSPNQDLTSAIQFASSILFRLSGRRFPGARSVTVWPCRGNGCGQVQPGSSWAFFDPFALPSVPVRSGSGWRNCWGRGCGSGECHMDSLDLPHFIDRVDEVVIGGEVLDPSTYMISDNRRLVRVDGGSWPCSNFHGPPQVFADSIYRLEQDDPSAAFELQLSYDSELSSIHVPSSVDAAQLEGLLAGALGVPGGVTVTSSGPDLFEVVFRTSLLGSAVTLTVDSGATLTLAEEGTVPDPGAWYVTYLAGRRPPPDGVFAASIFACQVGLAQCGSEACALPARLKSISREGVDLAFADPLDFLERGEVGIYEVDLWLQSVNPAKIQRRAAVYRADASPGPRGLRR